MHIYIYILISSIGHLEDIRSLGMQKFQMVLHYIVSHLLVTLAISSEKSLRIGKLISSQGQIRSFPKLWLLFESSDLIIANRYSWILLPLKRQTHFVHFQENLCQISKFEKPQFACQLFFQVKMVTYEKVASSVLNPSSHPSTWLETTIHFGTWQKCFMWLPSS